MNRTHSPNSPARRRSISLSTVLGSFAFALHATSAFAQTGQGVPAVGPPLDPRTLSCDALKDRLQRAGTLDVTGRQGWSDTFYARPQCDFWATPEYQYVTANDGACGLGYLCLWKPGGR